MDGPLYRVATSHGIELYVFHCMPYCDVFHVAVYSPELELSTRVSVHDTLEQAIGACTDGILEYDR